MLHGTAWLTLLCNSGPACNLPLRRFKAHLSDVYTFPWGHLVFILFLFFFFKRNRVKKKTHSWFQQSAVVFLLATATAEGFIYIRGLAKWSGMLHARWPRTIGQSWDRLAGGCTLAYGILYLWPGLLLCSRAHSFSAPLKFPIGTSQPSRAHWHAPEIFLMSRKTLHNWRFLLF